MPVITSFSVIKVECSTDEANSLEVSDRGDWTESNLMVASIITKPMSA